MDSEIRKVEQMSKCKACPAKPGQVCILCDPPSTRCCFAYPACIETGICSLPLIPNKDGSRFCEEKNKNCKCEISCADYPLDSHLTVQSKSPSELTRRVKRRLTKSDIKKYHDDVKRSGRKLSTKLS